MQSSQWSRVTVFLLAALVVMVGCAGLSEETSTPAENLFPVASYTPPDPRAIPTRTSTATVSAITEAATPEVSAADENAGRMIDFTISESEFEALVAAMIAAGLLEADVPIISSAITDDALVELLGTLGFPVELLATQNETLSDIALSYAIDWLLSMTDRD